MSEPDAPATREIRTFEDLVSVAELRGIVWNEQGARRRQPGQNPPIEGDQQLETSANVSAEQVDVRLRVEQWTDDAVLVADIIAAFPLSEPCTVDEQALGQFVERVAVMTAFPFVRESIFTSATRLGVAPPLFTLLRAGSFHLEMDRQAGG